MRWCSLLKLQQRLAGGPTNMLVTHLGDNDLMVMVRGALLQAMKADMGKISKYIQQCELWWSEIVPRRVWQGARSCEAVEHSGEA